MTAGGKVGPASKEPIHPQVQLRALSHIYVHLFFGRYYIVSFDLPPTFSPTYFLDQLALGYPAGLLRARDCVLPGPGRRGERAGERDWCIQPF